MVTGGDGWVPRECRGKVGWPKRKQALTALNMHLASHPEDPRAHLLGVYRCSTCRRFHIGHSSRVA